LSPKNIGSSYKKFLYSYVYAMLQNNNKKKRKKNYVKIIEHSHDNGKLMEVMEKQLTFRHHKKFGVVYLAY